MLITNNNLNYVSMTMSIISAVLGHACARYTSRQDVYHFHHSPMSYILGFKPGTVQTATAQKMRAAPPPKYREYEQIRANTLPRRNSSGSFGDRFYWRVFLLDDRWAQRGEMARNINEDLEDDCSNIRVRKHRKRNEILCRSPWI